MFLCMRFPVKCVRSCCLCGAAKDNLQGASCPNLKAFFYLSFLLIFNFAVPGEPFEWCSARPAGVQCSAPRTLGQALCCW